MTEFKLDIKKILSGCVVGLAAGGLISTVKEISKLSAKPDVPLGVSVPNMEDVNMDLVTVFKSFKGAFHETCPEKNRKKYRRLVHDSIMWAEAVMTIENQVRRGEYKDFGFKERSESAAYANLCMQTLKQTVQCFETEFISKIVDNIDKIGFFLSDSLTNIRNLTGDVK
jgi:hypothetical protein